MTPTRKHAFARQVMRQLSGMASLLRKDGMALAGDGIAISLKRGATTNNVAKIEFMPEPKGTVSIRFLDITGEVLSLHAGIPIDGIPSLLLAHAGIKTGPIPKEEGSGQLKTTRWA